jgi:hypothetical protein
MRSRNENAPYNLREVVMTTASAKEKDEMIKKICRRPWVPALIFGLVWFAFELFSSIIRSTFGLMAMFFLARTSFWFIFSTNAPKWFKVQKSTK